MINSNKIFVNRSLDMSKIKAIGFDLDHTLAVYHRENFEELAFEETLKKCIAAGYPEELSQLKFDHNFLIRGLLVDIDEGNILKVDSHKYVKKAFHGFEILAKDKRDALYNKAIYKAQTFLSVDTYFALSEIHLFLSIVQYMNENPGSITKSFRQIYTEIKYFIDLSHRDNSIKSKVLKDPAKYIIRDERIPATLARYIKCGKKTFLMTNSYWEYSNAVLTYLFEKSDNSNWRDYFNYVIVGSGKPGFFTGSQPFYEVIPESGHLKIINQKLDHNKVYFGGNAVLFQKLTGISGDEILYVGDHIFGDIVKPKGFSNWRTMLIIEELDSEISKYPSIQVYIKEILNLFEKREKIDEKIHILLTRTSEAGKEQSDVKKINDIKAEINSIRKELKAIDLKIKEKIAEKDAIAHPIWGELLRTGLEHSRFAGQVFDFACLYTSKVSNILDFSPYKLYIATKEIKLMD